MLYRFPDQDFTSMKIRTLKETVSLLLITFGLVLALNSITIVSASDPDQNHGQVKFLLNDTDYVIYEINTNKSTPSDSVADDNNQENEIINCGPNITMRIQTNRGEQDPDSAFMIRKRARGFTLNVYIDWVLTAELIKIRDELLFWSSIQLDMGDMYNISVQNVKDRWTQIANNMIEFSAISATEDMPNENTVTLNPAVFTVTKIKNFTATEIPTGLKITVKSWLNDTRGGELIKKADPEYNKLVKENENSKRSSSSSRSKTITSTTVKIASNECRNVVNCEPTLKISNINITTVDDRPLEMDGIIIGTQPEILLKWVIENTNLNTESALNPGVNIRYSYSITDQHGVEVSLGHDLSLLPLISTNSGDASKSIQCYHDDLLSLKNQSIKCTKSVVVPPTQNTTMEVRLNMTGLYPSFKKMKLKIHLNAIHEHDHGNNHENENSNRGGRIVNNVNNVNVNRNTNKLIELKLLTEAKVSIKGSQNSSSFSKGSNQHQLLHSYTVSLSGPSPVDKIELEFWIPIKRDSDVSDVLSIDGQPTYNSATMSTSKSNTKLRPMSIPLNCTSKIILPSNHISKTRVAESNVTESVPTTNSNETSTITTPRTENSEEEHLPDYDNKGLRKRRRRREVNSTAHASSKMQNGNPKKNQSLDIPSNKNNDIELSCLYTQENDLHDGQGHERVPNSGAVCKHFVCSIPNVDPNTSYQIDFPIKLSNETLNLLSPKSTGSVSQNPKTKLPLPAEMKIFIKSGATAQILHGETSENHTDKVNSQYLIDKNTMAMIGKQSQGRGAGVKFHIEISLYFISFLLCAFMH